MNISLVILVLITSCIAGCGTRSVTLDTNVQVSRDRLTAKPICESKLGRISDMRKDKDSLGNIYGSLVKEGLDTGGPYSDSYSTTETIVDLALLTSSRVASDRSAISEPNANATAIPEIIKWLINNLESAGLNDGSGVDDALRINVGLRIANITSSRSSKVSNIVLEVKFNDDADSQIVRGNDTSINWAGGAGEINSSFNRSLTQAIEKLIKLANEKC